jgi:hypothetical protein
MFGYCIGVGVGVGVGGVHPNTKAITTKTLRTKTTTFFNFMVKPP